MRPRDRTTADFAIFDEVPSGASWHVLVSIAGVEPRIVEIGSHVELLFGRGPACHVDLDHHGVSRRHARLVRRGDELTIEDLGSRNGTLVNGVAIAGARRLAGGDAIGIGPATAIVVASGGARRPEPARTASELGVVRDDPRTIDVFALAERAAVATIAVLVVGETGVGKDVVAEAVHRMSPRAAGPFVAVDCAALAESLVESVLFGHERGAFTGAGMSRAGFLESADRGTLFLDEVGELSPAVQAKLLRALERRAVVRVGGTREIASDFRLVCATRRDLQAEVRAGRFREDLYFRIGALVIAVPPLRERAADIAGLVRRFASGAAVSAAAMAAMERYGWPGNVRELKNAIEHAATMTEVGGGIELAHLPAALRGGAGGGAGGAHVEIESAALVAALDAAGGNQSRAARALGISRFALIRLIAKHGLAKKR